MLTEFILYLTEQLRQPYLWGGQHTRLTPLNYKAVIARRESKPENRRAAEAYCEKMFEEGYTELFAYDCSGLGVYWLVDLKHLWKSDVNANTMMVRCELRTDLPKRGWWVFRLTGNRATHIGYMVDDEYLIEAKGRDYGVVKTKFRAKDWGCWGIPNVFKDEIVDPPAPPVPPTEHYVEVIGGSVNVRTADSKKGKILFTAHRGDRFPFISTAPSGWYEIQTAKGQGFITNLPRYTTIV
jgi:hypothetical protein